MAPVSIVYPEAAELELLRGKVAELEWILIAVMKLFPVADEVHELIRKYKS